MRALSILVSGYDFAVRTPPCGGRCFSVQRGASYSELSAAAVAERQLLWTAAQQM